MDRDYVAASKGLQISIKHSDVFHKGAICLNSVVLRIGEDKETINLGANYDSTHHLCARFSDNNSVIVTENPMKMSYDNLIQLTVGYSGYLGSREPIFIHSLDDFDFISLILGEEYIDGGNKIDSVRIGRNINIDVKDVLDCYRRQGGDISSAVALIIEAAPCDLALKSSAIYWKFEDETVRTRDSIYSYAQSERNPLDPHKYVLASPLR